MFRLSVTAEGWVLMACGSWAGRTADPAGDLRLGLKMPPHERFDGPEVSFGQVLESPLAVEQRLVHIGEGRDRLHEMSGMSISFSSTVRRRDGSPARARRPWPGPR